MHKVLQDPARVLLSLSSEELRALAQAARDASALAADPTVAPRYGIAREDLGRLADELEAEIHASRRVTELVQTWESPGAVMVRVLNSYGDPVEMSAAGAQEFAEKLQSAIKAAS